LCCGGLSLAPPPPKPPTETHAGLIGINSLLLQQNGKKAPSPPVPLDLASPLLLSQLRDPGLPPRYCRKELNYQKDHHSDKQASCLCNASLGATPTPLPTKRARRPQPLPPRQQLAQASRNPTHAVPSFPSQTPLMAPPCSAPCLFPTRGHPTKRNSSAPSVSEAHPRFPHPRVSEAHPRFPDCQAPDRRLSATASAPDSTCHPRSLQTQSPTPPAAPPASWLVPPAAAAPLRLSVAVQLREWRDRAAVCPSVRQSPSESVGRAARQSSSESSASLSSACRRRLGGSALCRAAGRRGSWERERRRRAGALSSCWSSHGQHTHCLVGASEPQWAVDPHGAAAARRRVYFGGSQGSRAGPRGGGVVVPASGGDSR
jgi:hypothetical protein